MTSLPSGPDGTGPAPIHLWFCPNEDLAPGIAATLASYWLDEQEQEVADGFLFERDRSQYLIAHALVRRVLALETGIPEAEAVIWRSSRGRPFLQLPSGGLPRGADMLDFNLSHARAYNLLGVSREHRIGVDVERMDRGDRGLENIITTFCAEEQDWIARAAPGRSRDRRVLRLWTLKEAYSKARGLGLALPFDSFAFTLAEDEGVLSFQPPADDSAERWRFLEVEPVPEVLAAVAVEVAGPHPPAVHLHHGFPWGRAAPRRLVLPELVGASRRGR
ncbi:4'-phosphopantetheinyl transferase family protein [Streptomyces sp. NBC_00503]|uniref:4'-phosphopantetheinyl transferase family protein n=1 Tax=Streptomyces sp. NBC_00503 TaxID=2903659 RepID=UPI002E81D80F|nr:4'-phosphopantetheinyl transferase superfamily protein [Streptomyces sp. NBC_00503]WUD86367.1 4'-phosphopantetheinyl transferase superfamily protein [Streptomyces sp. NBC_00503]